MFLRNYETKRALRRQIKQLKEDVRYRDKKIDDLETDCAIANSLARRYKRENAELKRNGG